MLINCGTAVVCLTKPDVNCGTAARGKIGKSLTGTGTACGCDRGGGGDVSITVMMQVTCGCDGGGGCQYHCDDGWFTYT